jgi:hypothetical protein
MSAPVRATRHKTLIFCQGLAGSVANVAIPRLAPRGRRRRSRRYGPRFGRCGVSAANEPSDPPLSSDRGPGCRTAPAAPTGFVPNPDLQHATIPVGDAGGHDGSEAVCQTTTAATEPPIRGCRTAPAAPTGFVPNPDLQHATIPVGDAGGRDGTGRDSDDGDLAACFEILKALRPPPPTGEAGCYR